MEKQGISTLLDAIDFCFQLRNSILKKRKLLGFLLTDAPDFVKLVKMHPNLTAEIKDLTVEEISELAIHVQKKLPELTDVGARQFVASCINLIRAIIDFLGKFKV